MLLLDHLGDVFNEGLSVCIRVDGSLGSNFFLLTVTEGREDHLKLSRSKLIERLLDSGSGDGSDAAIVAAVSACCSG